MENQPNQQKQKGNKRRRKTSLSTAASLPKNIKLEISDTVPSADNQNSIPQSPASAQVSTVKNTGSTPSNANKKKKKGKKAKGALKNANGPITSPVESKPENEDGAPVKKKKKGKQLMAELNAMKEQIIGPTEKLNGGISIENGDETKTPQKKIDLQSEYGEKYPVLKNKELMKKFMKANMTNNQKGRIRQAIKLSLQGSSATMFPDLINGKIQAILTSTSDLTDSDLRRVRILYNMLVTALEKPQELEQLKTLRKKNKKKKEVSEDGAEKVKEEKPEDGVGEKPEKVKNKVKGPKRYVVFIGNLPLDISKEKIMEHFRELDEQIVDLRLPKAGEGKKSAIAFLELKNEPSYELALSKHHSMLDNRRIKVLYTAQQNGKVTKEEAKGKSAKLIALQKAGKLVGSIPTAKKRSHRRNIMKQAKAKEAQLSSAAV